MSYVLMAKHVVGVCVGVYVGVCGLELLYPDDVFQRWNILRLGVI